MTLWRAGKSAMKRKRTSHACANRKGSRDYLKTGVFKPSCLNPFASPTCKFVGLKSAYARLLEYCAFLVQILSHAEKKTKTKLQNFQFHFYMPQHIFMDACAAAKGLILAA